MPSLLGLWFSPLRLWLRRLWLQARVLPRRGAVRLLLRRFGEARLSLTASSLTFTTVVSLVPLLTVALSVLSVLPAFAQMQGSLQKWLVASLVPDPIARQVLGYLSQFAAKSSRLGVWSLLALLGAALMLLLTIEGSFNTLWRVHKRRPWTQRLLVYWALLTLGPLVLASSLAASSFVQGWSRALGIGGAPLLHGALQGLDIALLAAGAALLFRYLPSAPVRWPHAVLGGLWVAFGLAVTKKLLGLYLSVMPSYSLVYGAVATLPIFLTWLFTAWMVVLMGAVVTATLPELRAGARQHRAGPGWRFQLALELLRQLQQVRQHSAGGLGLHELADAVQVELAQVTPVLAQLQKLDWVACLDEPAARWVLIAEPSQTLLAPLLHSFLLPNSCLLHDLSAQSVLNEVL